MKEYQHYIDVQVDVLPYPRELQWRLFIPLKNLKKKTPNLREPVNFENSRIRMVES